MLRVGSIVLRVDDLQRQADFWEAALGYERHVSLVSVELADLGMPARLGHAVVDVAPQTAATGTP